MSARNPQIASRLAELLLWICVIPVLYLVAAAVGGSIPRNADWREPEDGVTIYVATNGFHTGLILPMRAEGVDWSGVIRPSHLADPRYVGTHIWIGWGERAFYLGTPRWQDLRLATVIGAATGSDAVLIHVDHVVNPLPDAETRPLRLTMAQYQRLAAYVSASFGADPRPIPGYGPADIFYEGRGRYDAIRTCNQWTGDALAAAGVRIGAWTPTSATVMQWFG